MTIKVKKIRDKIIKDNWKNWKSEITMLELSEIFNISLAKLYTILKKNEKTNN